LGGIEATANRRY